VSLGALGAGAIVFTLLFIYFVTAKFATALFAIASPAVVVAFAADFIFTDLTDIGAWVDASSRVAGSLVFLVSLGVLVVLSGFLKAVYARKCTSCCLMETEEIDGDRPLTKKQQAAIASATVMSTGKARRGMVDLAKYKLVDGDEEEEMEEKQTAASGQAAPTTETRTDTRRKQAPPEEDNDALSLAVAAILQDDSLLRDSDDE